MKSFDLSRFEYRILCDERPEKGQTAADGSVNARTDAEVTFEEKEGSLSVYLAAKEDRPQFVLMQWTFPTQEDLYVLGDAWERSYGELCFKKLSENDRPMPWYFAATNQQETYCFGVRTQPNAFVCFTYDRTGITAKIDCRNGGRGVRLNGRKLKLCTFVLEHYKAPPIESLHAYCKKLCDRPILPKEKIYGGNNWYYAYGKSSYEEMIRDAKLQKELAEGIENPPFMVVDDGWEINRCCGPFEANESYRDMKALAEEMKRIGVRPGIWIRLLHDRSEEITEDMRILRNGERTFLDPTNVKVQAFLREEIEKIKGWGYELLKHDFTTVDLFGKYGKDLTDTITDESDWHFEDDTKTNAEIVLDLYRLIKDACKDMLIIGCNTISHLCAGLVQINRTGDDTSGREWKRTRKMGINTLAFRLAQNNAFYVVDADCVGIMDKNIPWELNKQWLDLLSRSDTALFTSCGIVGEQEREDIAKAYREIQKDHQFCPVDIYENFTPREWETDNELTVYDWDEK